MLLMATVDTLDAADDHVGDTGHQELPPNKVVLGLRLSLPSPASVAVVGDECRSILN